MKPYEKSKYEDYGKRLKDIRTKLGLTLENIRQHIGISRSYVSEFEKGIKLPTVKYLRYLHDRHGINLNYVFRGQHNMFRENVVNEHSEPVFGGFQNDVADMIKLMEKVPHALHHILAYVAEYKVNNHDFLKNFNAVQREVEKLEL